MSVNFEGCQTFGRQYSDEAQGQVGTRVYRVTSDADVPDLSEVLSYTLIPEIGDSWGGGSYAGLQCVKRTPEEVDYELRTFRVVCEFATDSSYRNDWDLKIDPKPIDEIPLTTKAEYDPVTGPSYFIDGRFIGAPNTDTSATGASGSPIVNTAGDYFDKTAKTKRYISLITLTKTFNSLADFAPPDIVDVEDLEAYQGTMNDDIITIAGIPGDVWSFKIAGISLERLRQANDTYDTKVTIKIEYDPRTHAKAIINSGYNKTQIIEGERVKVVARTKDGASGRQPALLDEDGDIVLEGPDDYDLLDGPPYYVVFPVDEVMNFALLGLPTTWE